jgi:phosphatidate cytidylyltransferase
MLLTVFFCVQEYLLVLKKYEPHLYISLAMSVAFFILLFFDNDSTLTAFCALSMLFVLFVFEVVKGNVSNCIARISTSFLGSFFLPLSLSYLIYIRQLQNGMEFIFFLFITTWVLDTAAFFFGVKFGRHKLAKNVSPKKTVEGAVAGIIFGILTAVLCRFIFMSGFLTVYQSAIAGFIIALTGQFSDLAESLFKRDSGVKDSGAIIPGHGGFLDRFDSYLFAAPALYYLLSHFNIQ